MLVVVNGLQAGNRSGTGTYTRELARWLPRVAGQDTVRVVWPADTPVPEGMDPEAFVIRPTAGAARRVLYDQAGFRVLARRLSATVTHYPANIGSILPARGSVLTVHDLSFMRQPEWFRTERAQYYRHAVAWSVRHAARVIAVSQATADDLVELLQVPRERIDVVHLGVESEAHRALEDERAAVRRKYALPQRFVLFLGTHEPRKNLVRLVNAFERIAGETTADLVLAGREGWKVEPIREAVDRSPVSHRIHQPGFIESDDRWGLISGAEVFVYPSLCEGFGLPVVDAMACGVPVLTSNTSSLKEIAGQAAITVDPENVDAIARGLHMLLTDTSLRTALAEHGPAHAARFSWKRCAEQTMEIYRRVADEVKGDR